MQSILKPISYAFLLGSLSLTAQAEKKVNITDELASITVKHQGKIVTIERNQNSENVVKPTFAKTSRPCPPFCIQPMTLAPGVETIGEVEMLAYLEKLHKGDDTLLVIDSRTPKWVKKGTIPGAINIPWTELNPDKGASYEDISDILVDEFGVEDLGGLFSFGYAKTLVLFCNGMWCGQSPANIKQLLRHGYPAHKIKWYRGGMQNWENLGFTTIK